MMSMLFNKFPTVCYCSSLHVTGVFLKTDPFLNLRASFDGPGLELRHCITWLGIALLSLALFLFLVGRFKSVDFTLWLSCDFACFARFVGVPLFCGFCCISACFVPPSALLCWGIAFVCSRLFLRFPLIFAKMTPKWTEGCSRNWLPSNMLLCPC